MRTRVAVFIVAAVVVGQSLAAAGRSARRALERLAPGVFEAPEPDLLRADAHDVLVFVPDEQNRSHLALRRPGTGPAAGLRRGGLGGRGATARHGRALGGAFGCPTPLRGAARFRAVPRAVRT